MLSNRKLYWAILLMGTMIISCSEKKPTSSENLNAIDYENPKAVQQLAKSVVDNDVKFAYKGKFDKDSVIEIAAGTEIKSPKEWGIKFFLLKRTGDQLDIVFQSALLNGSFKDCLVQKIKFPFFDYELIYYNSQNFFLGSGGGEVYSYLVNYNEGKTYYAHLIMETDKPISLYLSDDIDISEVKNFFISNFKRDYPSLHLVSKDIVVKY